jgi:hypothetical protein
MSGAEIAAITGAVLEVVLLALVGLLVVVFGRLDQDVRHLAAVIAPDGPPGGGTHVVRRHCGFTGAHGAHGAFDGLGGVWLQCPGGGPGLAGRHAWREPASAPAEVRS